MNQFLSPDSPLIPSNNQIIDKLTVILFSSMWEEELGYHTPPSTAPSRGVPYSFSNARCERVNVHGWRDSAFFKPTM
jgi:hypothetical protein